MFYTGWVFETAMSVVMPLLFGIMIDEIVYFQNLKTFLSISMIFIVFAVFSCVLYFFIYAQHSYLMNMFSFDIKKAIFIHTQKCGAEYMADMKSGELISLVDNHAAECMHFIIRNIIHTINCVIVLVVVSLYLFFLNWQIGIFIFIAAPVITFLNIKFGNRIRSYGDATRQIYNGYVSWLFERIAGLRDLRILNAKNRVGREFTDHHRNIFSVMIKSGVSEINAQNIVDFAGLAVQLAIYVFAGYYAIQGDITMGSLTVIIAFYAIITENTKSLSQYYLNGQKRISFIQRIYDFLDTPTEDTWQGKDELKISSGSIAFRSLGFTYKNGYTVLEDLSLEIAAGERFALVGKSGSGKTTLSYMLAGFYGAGKGHIEIDGQRLDECSLSSIRRNIGIIQQDVLLFNLSIKENILLGNRKAGKDEIVSACGKAGILDFILTLPQGFNTTIGYGGVELSGGQKQRIAIARIYLKNPKIIIFDEATSSLDSETEAFIHQAWEEVLKGKTVIVIAHRLSSVLFCDRVGILENGKIAECGVPLELMKTSGKFRELFAVNDV